MGKTENNKYLPGNILTIGLYKYIRIKALLHSSLPEKCNYFLYYVGGLFLVGSESESVSFINTIPGQRHVKKKFWFRHLPVLRL